MRVLRAKPSRERALLSRVRDGGRRGRENADRPIHRGPDNCRSARRSDVRHSPAFPGEARRGTGRATAGSGGGAARRPRSRRPRRRGHLAGGRRAPRAGSRRSRPDAEATPFLRDRGHRALLAARRAGPRETRAAAHHDSEHPVDERGLGRRHGPVFSGGATRRPGDRRRGAREAFVREGLIRGPFAHDVFADDAFDRHVLADDAFNRDAFATQRSCAGERRAARPQRDSRRNDGRTEHGGGQHRGARRRASSAAHVASGEVRGSARPAAVRRVDPVQPA